MISAYSELPSSQALTTVLSGFERLCELGVCSMSSELLESWRMVLTDPGLSESDRLAMCVALTVLVLRHLSPPVTGEAFEELKRMYDVAFAIRLSGEVG
nr:MAG TPA: hypothetical protein [Caudoviricetes sp.]